MNADEVLRIVNQIHLDKKLDREVVFRALEQALAAAFRKQYEVDEESDLRVMIDRQSGEFTAYLNSVPIPIEEVRRAGTQSARQVLNQKLKEAEAEIRYEKCRDLLNKVVRGRVTRIVDRGKLIVELDDGIIGAVPVSEKIPGEMIRKEQWIAVEVVKVPRPPQKVEPVLSRVRPSLIKAILTGSVPEIEQGVIEIKNVVREPGNLTKIAVYCNNPRVDVVGACIGPRAARLRDISNEFGKERIEVIPFEVGPEGDNDIIALNIANALSPARIDVDQVIICHKLGRAIVLVPKEERSVAIGRKGQNVRLASRLVGWDIEIMLREELEESLTNAQALFTERLNGVSSELVESLVGEGFLSFDDISVIEPEDLCRMGNITMEEAEAIIEQADQLVEEQESQMALENERMEAASGAQFSGGLSAQKTTSNEFVTNKGVSAPGEESAPQ